MIYGFSMYIRRCVYGDVQLAMISSVFATFPSVQSTPAKSSDEAEKRDSQGVYDDIPPQITICIFYHNFSALVTRVLQTDSGNVVCCTGCSKEGKINQKYKIDIILC